MLLFPSKWKLIDSLNGANASAIIYSITETAKANNLNPFRYLEHVLTVLKDHHLPFLVLSVYRTLFITADKNKKRFAMMTAKRLCFSYPPGFSTLKSKSQQLPFSIFPSYNPAPFISITCLYQNAESFIILCWFL